MKSVRQHGKTSNFNHESAGVQTEGTGTREWADQTLNIVRGCSHGCLYGYCRMMASRFGEAGAALRAEPASWACEQLIENTKFGKNVKPPTTWPISKPHTVMFPSMHDITPKHLDSAIETLGNLLANNNNVLIVTKPHCDCIQKITEKFVGSRDRILFRFTITTLNQATASFWEPGAPSPAERVHALTHAWKCGYRTSVSCEPMLDSVDQTVVLVNKLKRYVTDTVWVGKMNRCPSKLNLAIPGFTDARNVIASQQADNEILRLVGMLKNNPKIRWKDSIKAVIAQANEAPSRSISEIL
jgi:DNA repair photolyase